MANFPRQSGPDKMSCASESWVSLVMLYMYYVKTLGKSNMFAVMIETWRDLNLKTMKRLALELLAIEISKK